MLFWTRAFLCVGTVTVLAVQRLPSDARSARMPAVSGPAAAALVGKACRARPDLCATALTRGLGALAPATETMSRSHPKAPHRNSGHELPVALGLGSLT